MTPTDLHDFSEVAENYDLYLKVLLGGKEDGVVPFHLDLARQYGREGVVDIACGTGATLLPLAEAGFRVTGLDISQAMLDVLKRKLESLPAESRARTTVIRANMTDFQVEAPISLAIIPRSGFMHLLTSAEQEKALRCIHQALAPGGILSFNTFDPNYEMIARNLKGSSPALQFRGLYTNRRGLREWIWNRTVYDPATQCIEGVWIFEEMDADGFIVDTREYPLRMRWSFESEIRHLLRLCDFEVLDLFSSYEQTPRAYGGNLVWVARRMESNGN